MKPHYISETGRVLSETLISLTDIVNKLIATGDLYWDEYSERLEVTILPTPPTEDNGDAA